MNNPLVRVLIAEIRLAGKRQVNVCVVPTGRAIEESVAHAKRYGMVQSNPIEVVRCSAKRLREPDVLTPVEFKRLLDELPLRERVMVMVAGTTACDGQS